MRRTTYLSLSIALSVVCSAAGAETSPSKGGDWPRWRGPLANGTAPDAAPPTTWSETEKIKWKMKIPGFGTSTPIVWKDQVFVVTAIPTGKKSEPAAAPAPAQPAPDASSDGPGAGGPGGPGGEGRRRRGGGGGGMRSEKPSEAYQFAVIAVETVR